MQVFLDRWVIMGNIFLILEEYDHLKRKPGEIIHQFSARFNEVYHSIPVDVRPPPGLAKLHFLDAFDPEMAFQLRERNTASLEEMQNIAVDVETNLLIKRSKLKDKEKEQLKSSEAKLQILASAMEKMMQKINIKEELAIQRHHVPLISEKDTIIVPKHFSAHPGYHGLNNDSFMYSIHNTVKDEAPSQLVEEQPADMICMFNGISSMDDLPKCDQYDDDHEAEIEVVCSKKPAACHWQEGDHLQLRCDNQPVHNSHDSDEEETENFRVREKSLPLCFSSFQFLRRNCKQVGIGKEGEFSDQLGEDVSVDVEVVLNPELQPFTYFDFQIPEERLKPEANSELIQNNSVPLCFNSFQFLKKNFEYMLKDKYTENQEVAVEPMQQSVQFLQDPISDVLDDWCCQSLPPSSSYGIKHCYDIDMIRQSTSLSFSAEASFQNPSRKLQPCQEMHEDENNIDTVPEHVAYLAESKNQGTCHFYLDPIATYMENFFTVEPQSISGITFVFQDCRGLYGKYQSRFQQWPFHFAVLSRWEKVKLCFSLC
jgi:hypothetical protein